MCTQIAAIAKAVIIAVLLPFAPSPLKGVYKPHFENAVSREDARFCVLRINFIHATRNAHKETQLIL